MADDFLQRLAELEVAAPPAEFDRQLHDRLNHRLMVQQFLDLLVRGMPWALLHFGRAIVELCVFSISGHFADERKKENRDSL
jgi:hypothetical protein